VFAFAPFLAGIYLSSLAVQDSQLMNPIIPGFSADPSICRVGNDFYLVNSSFVFYPGVPIRHSTDLSNWEMIGHCLTRDSQLPLGGPGNAGGIFAPAIRYHDGVFYMVTTNVGAGGNFLVSASDIRGPWSERVNIDVDSIDPSLFWDDDGTCYLTVQGTEGIRQATFDPKTGKVLGEMQVVWTGTGGQWPEGPHLFKREDFYYLTVAEGGTEYGHMQTLARSKSPMGPFESCPFNPVLTHRSSSSPFQAIGHADFFDDGRGKWWAVCLGIRPQGYPYGHNLGRETMLVPVEWGDDGWPRLGDHGRVPVSLDLPKSETANRPEVVNFVGGKVPMEWSYLRNPDLSKYQKGSDAGLKLIPSKFLLSDIASPTWVGRPQKYFEATLLVECESKLSKIGEGGVSIRQNEKHRMELFMKDGEVCLRATIGPLVSILKSEKIGEGRVTLEVVMHADRYDFECLSGGRKIELGSVPAHYFSTEVAGGFTGVMLGVYATSNDEQGHFGVTKWSYLPTLAE
jgi:xylan 1,4-beta-xylosidase